MPELKMFLKVRDTSEAYAAVRGSGRIGIPCLLVGEEAHILNGAEHIGRIIGELGLGMAQSYP